MRKSRQMKRPKKMLKTSQKSKRISPRVKKMKTSSKQMRKLKLLQERQRGDESMRKAMNISGSREISNILSTTPKSLYSRETRRKSYQRLRTYTLSCRLQAQTSRSFTSSGRRCKISKQRRRSFENVNNSFRPAKRR
jgi:hypothetical protein